MGPLYLPQRTIILSTGRPRKRTVTNLPAAREGPLNLRDLATEEMSAKPGNFSYEPGPLASHKLPVSGLEGVCWHVWLRALSPINPTP